MKNTSLTTLILAIGLLGINKLSAQEIYPGKAKKAEKEISAAMPFESKYIDIGSEKIHYIESGEGDPVLMLHGLPANLYVWRNIVPNIDDDKKVIALDFLGFGKSSFPKDSVTSINVQYKMFTDFVEAKNLKNITLYIQDIGSLVGMLYAIREPQNVKGIVLFEAPFMPAAVMYDQLPFSFRAFMKLTRTRKGNERFVLLNMIQLICSSLNNNSKTIGKKRKKRKQKNLSIYQQPTYLLFSSKKTQLKVFIFIVELLIQVISI